jgi:glycosyltransferase involved in cell wall biosynthesis
LGSIVFYTAAYNAEKTLTRAIESVRGQTFGDWIWILMDNGSNDSTAEIIRSFAQKDSRIVYRSNQINGILDPGNSLSELSAEYGADDFFCVLDADDEYKPDFLEKTLNFARVNQLDVACVGNDFIDAETNRVLGVRKLEQDLILTEPEHFSQYFPFYHQFVRPLWGKLTKIKYLRNLDYSFIVDNLRYGGDTYINLAVFSAANRVGIIGESLYRYYQSTKSVSYRFDFKRIASDRLLHEATRNYLLDKCGEVGPQHEMFLYHVYFHAINDTLRIVSSAQIPALEKMQAYREIFTCVYTQELFRRNDADFVIKLKNLRDSVSAWILAQNTCRQKNGAETAAEIFLAMDEDLAQWLDRDGLGYILSKIPEMTPYLFQRDYSRVLERLSSWFKRHDADIPTLTKLEIMAYSALKKPDDEIFTLLLDIRKKRPQSSKVLGIDRQICDHISKYPLLAGISAKLASALPKVLCRVMKGDYSQALKAFSSANNMKISDADAEAYSLLGQNLAAAADQAQGSGVEN